jgi:hypothetical protein
MEKINLACKGSNDLLMVELKEKLFLYGKNAGRLFLALES